MAPTAGSYLWVLPLRHTTTIITTRPECHNQTTTRPLQSNHCHEDHRNRHDHTQTIVGSDRRVPPLSPTIGFYSCVLLLDPTGRSHRGDIPPPRRSQPEHYHQNATSRPPPPDHDNQTMIHTKSTTTTTTSIRRLLVLPFWVPTLGPPVGSHRWVFPLDPSVGYHR